MRAYLDPDLPTARRLADAVAQRVSRGDRSGRLLGVPISIKDNMAFEGATLTAGSRILEGYRAPYTSHVLERLVAEGAVLLGRTNMDEFAMGASTENSAYFATRNPWDLACVPGGSSGGSAAAVAAGIVPVALGSETGGSIRQPAALCGITGFKPTYGSVSRFGLVAFGSSLDQIGPLAAHADDAALVYDVIAGHDPRDSTSLRGARASAYSAAPTLASLRVGVPEEFLDDAVDTGVRLRVEDALAVLRSAGASVRSIKKGRLRHVGLSIPVYYLVACSEASANLARFDGLRYGPRVEGEELAAVLGTTRGTRFGPEVRRRIVLGTFALSAGFADAWYGKAMAVRGLIRAEFDDLFAEFDLLAGPTSPILAFPLGSRTEDPYAMYLCDLLTAPACLAGLPSVSVPCGLSPGARSFPVPVGLSLTGPAGSDARVLASARAFERARGEPERVQRWIEPANDARLSPPGAPPRPVT